MIAYDGYFFVLTNGSDTNIDAFQGDTVHLIETSGRTLLDTLDHVRLSHLFSSRQKAARLHWTFGSRLLTD